MLKTIFMGKDFSTEKGQREFNRLFTTKNKIFQSPKSPFLIAQLIETCTSQGDIVMDFFAGSATCAHSVYHQNLQDGKERKFMLVQIPELVQEDSVTFKSGYSNISEVGKERIRRVILEVEKTLTDETAKSPLFPTYEQSVGLGFKVFKYTFSNFKQWKPPQEENADTLTPLFDNLSDPLIQGWKKDDLLSEVLLLEGFPLTSKVTCLEDHLKNEVYQVSAPDFCAHDLFVCLDETVNPVTIDLLTMEKEDIFICLDSALSDELKARLQDQFNVHVI